jgi:membrane associated rhomboid family serine protease
MVKRARFLPFLSLTVWLIIISCALSLAFFIVAGFFPNLVSYLVLTPSLFVQGRTWTLLTSIFLHAGFFHLFVNMFSLFFLGMLTEQIIGRKRMFWLYFISGIVGGLFYVGFSYLGAFVPRGDFLFGTPAAAAVGASGALFGLLGVLSVLIPNKKVDLIAGPLIVIILAVVVSPFLSGKADSIFSIIINIFVFVMIIGLFSRNAFFRRLAFPIHLNFKMVPIVAIVPLFIISFALSFRGISLPIGNTAHLGGLVAGLLYGWYLRVKYARKVVLLNRAIR